MLGAFSVIRDQFKSKQNCLCIDNWVFKLHYRATVLIFCIATVLVTSREYIGEHIRCITGLERYEKVIESFCFFTTTFTVVDERQNNPFHYGNSHHRGIIPFTDDSKQTIRKHTYYQWVPFLLFIQAVMFYVTHLIWKSLEDSRIRKLVAGLDHSKYALLDKEIHVDTQIIPTKEQRAACIKRIKTAFLQRIKLNRSWAKLFVVCEVLNLLHVVFQGYITHKFLGNQFYSLGYKVMTEGSEILDEVFPKVTKCTFRKYGPSGSIQLHDTLCVMALNIINEKIYVFLWFWLIILFVASCLVLIWRLLTIVLYSRSMQFNQFVFGHTSQGKLYPWHLNMVIKSCTYPDWLLLKYLSKNMDGLAFRELFVNISEELEERKPLFMLLQKEKSTPADVNKFE